MSPINFDSLQADYPEHAAVWAALRHWFSRNSTKQYVELAVLVRALKTKVEPLQVVNGVRLMIERGMLLSAWRIKAPGGYLLEDDFEAPDQIPDELWDRDHGQKINIDDGELVSGYRWAPTDAA